MIVGSTVSKMDGVGEYYGPEFPRGGLAATVSVDVTHMAGSPTGASGRRSNEDDDPSPVRPGFDPVPVPKSPQEPK